MNLFRGIPSHPVPTEICEQLVANTAISIERIISTGQASPPDFWYDQEQDEWVTLLQGSAQLSWQNGDCLNMKKGDWVLIPAHQKHRVDWTSTEPPCIWLAVHGKLT